MKAAPLFDYQSKPVSPEHQTAMIMADIQKHVIELLKRPKVPLYIQIDKVTEVTTLNPVHPMIQLLHAYYQFDEFLAIDLFSKRGFCPYVGLLLNADSILNIRAQLQLHHEGEMIQIPFNGIKLLNRLHGNLRVLSKGKAFKTSVNAYYRIFKERLVSFNEYVHSLFGHYARLLLIRVDLGYGEGNTVSYDEFREDFDHFTHLIQNNPVFDHLRGNIWKIEYGNSKGYHAHLLFFFDGSKRRADRYIAEQIGELWKHLSKQTNSTYFNCNTKKHKKQYESCCLGQVHRDDLLEIQCLHNELIPYLLKVDEFLRLTKQDNRRLTGRGISLWIMNEPTVEFEHEINDLK